MKKTVLFLALAFLLARPALGQPDSAKIAALSARVDSVAASATANAVVYQAKIAQLEKIVGLAYVAGPQLPESTFIKTQLVPANELPSGDYNFGVMLKLLNYIIRDQRSDLNGLFAKMPLGTWTVPAYVNAAVASVSATQGPPGPTGATGATGPMGPAGPAGSGTGGGSTGAGYQLFDTRVFHLGPPDGALTRALALGENAVSINAGSNPGSGTAGILLSAKLPVSQTFVYQNGGDRSFRILYNYNHFDPTLMVLRNDWEQDGVISWSTEPPTNSGRGPWDYPNTQGKMLAIRPAGHNPTTGQAGRFAQLYSGGLGRGLQFGVARTYPNVMDTPSIQIDTDDGANPVSVTVGGALRRLRTCSVGGVNVVCF
jgi:hypothetical protein